MSDTGSPCSATLAVDLAAGTYNPRQYRGRPPKIPGAFRWKLQAMNEYGHASGWSDPAPKGVLRDPQGDASRQPSQ